MVFWPHCTMHFTLITHADHAKFDNCFKWLPMIIILRSERWHLMSMEDNLFHSYWERTFTKFYLISYSIKRQVTLKGVSRKENWIILLCGCQNEISFFWFIVKILFCMINVSWAWRDLNSTIFTTKWHYKSMNGITNRLYQCDGIKIKLAKLKRKRRWEKEKKVIFCIPSVASKYVTVLCFHHTIFIDYSLSIPSSFYSLSYVCM